MGRKKGAVRKGEHRKYGDPHVCEICGKEYLSSYKRTRWCSRRCATVAACKTRELRNPEKYDRRYWTKKGYILAYVPNHPYASGGYVMEHRVVMEKIIGRFLLPEEVVHHLNGKKNDNRPENLRLMLKVQHDRALKPPPKLVLMVCPHCQNPIYLFGRARLAAVRLLKEPPIQSRV
jgi:hypothetical protein